MTTETMTIQILAAETVLLLERHTRDDGSTYWYKLPDCGRWLTDLCHDAHGDMLPDDYRYEYVVDALTAFSEYDDADEAVGEIKADPYTKDLLAWLSSHSYRVEYADEAAKEMGFSGQAGIMAAAALGQIAEKGEVYQSVLDSLGARLEALA